MRRLLAVLALAGCGAIAAPRVYDRACDVLSRRSDRGGVYCVSADTDAGVSFLFTLSPPASEECTCAASTSGSVLGGASIPISAARSSVAYCTVGSSPNSGISTDGGLVLCAADKIRVTYGNESDGGLGVQAEASMLNYCYGSEALNGADWDVFASGGVAAPTITANAATAPNGAVTAERLQFPATTEEDNSRSIIYSVAADCPPSSICADGKVSASIFAKGHSAAQVLGLGVTGTDGPGGYRVTKCTLASASTYTRCLVENINVTAGGGGVLFLGTLSLYDGTDYAAADVDVWGAQCECNRHATSYYPTAVGAVGTRAADAITASLLIVPQGSNLTVSAQTATDTAVSTSAAIVDLEQTITGGSNTNYFDLAVSASAKVECNNLVANVTDTIEGPLLSVSALNTLSCSFDGDSTITACVGSVCDAGTATSAPVQGTTLGIGAKWTGAAWAYQPNTVIKNVRISESATRLLDLFGDSIIAGANLSTFDAKPQGVIHAYNGDVVAVQNFGVGGDTIEESYAIWNEELARVVGSGLQSRTTMVAASGTNSSVAPGDGGTAVTNVTFHLKLMVAQARDAGVTAYATTLVPRAALASFVTDVNNIMRDAGAIDTFTPLAVTDGGVAFRDGCALADEVHPNDGGTYVLTRTICTGTGICTVPAPTGACQ